MEKNRGFRFFAIFVVLITIILFLGFVLAALSAPTGLIFRENTTASFDKEGTLLVNWTAVTNAESYSIFIYADDALFTVGSNDTITGFSFSNTTDANYKFTIQAENTTASQEANSTNLSITVDMTDPVISFTTGTPTDNTASNTLTSIFVNVSVTETNEDTINFTLYNSTSLVSESTFTDSTRTINFTGLPVNVAYTYVVNVNDSATRSASISRTLTLDNVAPTVTLTKKTSGASSLQLTISGEGTCTADRSGATISGSTLTENGLSCSKSYTYTVTCTDSAGNAGASSATSFSTTGCSSSDGTVPTPPPKKIQSWSKITPGAATIMKNFDPEIGIKEIQIEVNNNAQNVKITVTKYAGKPAAVSVVKSGKVFQYIGIDTFNLEDDLNKATVMFRAGKSWISSNNLDANDIALFRFDESAGQWNEIPTTHTGSEGDDEIYEVELTSFSFFAISEKGTTGTGETGETGTETGETGEEGKRSLAWLWVLIALVILVGLGWKIRTQKK